ncbi:MULTISPECIES: flagellar FlbD family protein [unclassified Actinotalea]|uniref:flagellar FlbD family protein n=1 Tax=unclassified Actinotalea TaxID=2638618 RepID=UPI0015F72194|nr:MULTISPECIES: flagellar FlbD family protein [unclassified Actinotalea]
MIVVTRLNGPRFAVNPDLLQRAESTPDTILTLIDGTKYIVTESLEEITELVIRYRARVAAATLDASRETAELAPVTDLRHARALSAVPEAD